MDPEPELDPEPMFGQGVFDVEPDFEPGAAGGFDDGAEAGGAVLVELDPGVVVVVAAPAMPAAAPPVASAPATIVAPSNFDIRIGMEPPLDGWMLLGIHRARSP